MFSMFSMNSLKSIFLVIHNYFDSHDENVVASRYYQATQANRKMRNVTYSFLFPRRL